MATTSATITFSQAGVQPPVYVTSALSGWTPLEMDVAPDKTPDGHVLFTKTFTNVPQGSYQYKVRLGQDHWVLDESKETAADDQGIHNNVIHVEPANDTTPQTSIPDAAPAQALSPNDAPAAILHESASKRLENRKDSTMDQDQLPDLPADTKPFKSEQASKVDSPVGSETSKQPDVPLVVLDKVDDIPAHGEQSSKDATAAQKVARDMRAADASPDKVNIVPEQHAEPDPVQLSADQEQAAPMFRHESFQSEEPPAAPSMDTIDEESTPSSADQTSSGDAMDTPSELDDGDEGDELNIMPLLSHETALGQESREIANGSLFTDEAELDDHPVHRAPLFSHETNLPDDTAVTTDSDGADELDRHPLLAHESGLSDYKGSEIVTKSDYTQEEKPRHRGPFDDDDEFDEYPEGPDDDAPLLPHEREAANANNTGSDSGHDDGSFSLEKQSAFDYETDNAKSLFGGTARHDFFRPRTNSSLPHRLPRSDAEDEDLNDPSLERFPTNRDQIFQRVATIGTTLPEDETRHSHPHSPQPSVFSQACSSVDLAPVKSYTSLASVPEADDSDEEEEDNHDLDSIPSPVYIGKKHMLRMSNSPSAFARDPYATPVTEASKRLGDAIETKDHAIESSGEADNINSHDGAEDTPEPANTLRDAISMPDKADATPVKSSRNETSDVAHSDPVVDSNLRQRKGVAEEASQKSDAPRTTDDDSTTTKDKSTDAVSSSFSADTQQSEKRQDASSKPSGVSRLLTACVGDRKVASASALVLGGAIAVYYFVARAS